MDSIVAVDTSFVENKILPNYNDLILKLSSASNCSFSLKDNLPSSFLYYDKVSNIKNSFDYWKYEAGDIRFLIDEKISIIQSNESKYESQVSELASSFSVGERVVQAFTNKSEGEETNVESTTGSETVDGFISFFKELTTVGIDFFVRATGPISSLAAGIVDLGKGIFTGDWSFSSCAAVKASHTKGLASALNLGISLVSGAISFLEKILDGIFVGLGNVMVCFGRYLDVALDVTIDGKFDGTETPFSDAIREFTVTVVGYCWTDWLFDEFYSIPIIKAIDDNSYDSFKRGGTIYEIGEGVGYYGAMTLCTSLTGMPAWLVTGVASLGKNSEKRFSKLKSNTESDESKVTAGEYWKAVGLSTANAVVDGGFTYLADMKLLTDRIDKILPEKVKEYVKSKIVIKALKSFASEGVNALENIGNDEYTYDFGGALKDFTSVIIAEVGFNFLSSKVEKLLKGKIPGTDNIDSNKETDKMSKQSAAIKLSESNSTALEEQRESFKDNAKQNAEKFYKALKKTAKKTIEKAEGETVKTPIINTIDNIVSDVFGDGDDE